MREINQAGKNLVKSFEGIIDGDPSTVNLDPYKEFVKWNKAGGKELAGLTRRRVAESELFMRA